MQGDTPGTGYGPPSHPSGPGQQQMAPPSPAGSGYPPAARRGSWLAVGLGVLAVVLAAAALTVSLVRKPQAPAPPAPAPAALPAQQLFVADADKALCRDIAPLMRENEDRGTQFAALNAGSPEQAAAIPGYRSFVEDWARRTQDSLNKHADPPRYLIRTLQRFIDDKLLYVEMVQPGRVDKFDASTWQQAAIDYGGPLGTCRDVGVTW